MRKCLFVLLFAGPGIGAATLQEEGKYANRFGYEVNLRVYPQKTPQEALQSLVKLLGEERFDYVLAHLADPGFVDSRVAEYRRGFPQASEQGKTILAFRRLVKETTEYFREEPALLKELRLFNKEAEWDVGEDRAVGTVKQLAGRSVVFRRLEDRWFLENRQGK